MLILCDKISFPLISAYIFIYIRFESFFSLYIKFHIIIHIVVVYGPFILGG